VRVADVERLIAARADVGAKDRVGAARRPLRSASPLPPSATPPPAPPPPFRGAVRGRFRYTRALGAGTVSDKFRTFRRHHARSAFSRLTQFVSAVAVRRIVYFRKASVLRGWGLLGATGRRVA